MDSRLQSPVSPHTSTPPFHIGLSTQGASVGIPAPAPDHEKKPAIVYTGGAKEEGPRPQAVALSSWQSVALAVLAFSSVVTMGMAMGVLAMVVKLGKTVETATWDGKTVHMLRVDNSLPL